MKTLLSTVIAGLSMMAPAGASLPTLKEKPWLGFYAGFENKKFQFSVDQNAKIKLVILNAKGEPMAKAYEIPIEVGVEDTSTEGKTWLRKFVPESLVATEPPNGKFEKCSIRGKVTGEASFELNLSQDRGVISLGGRITDPGKLAGRPIRFVIRPKFPNAYPYDKPGLDKKAAKTFEKKIEDDRIDLKWTDGKKTKLTFENEVDAGSKEVNGPGVAEAEVEISTYKDVRFLLTATPDSAMKFSNEKTAPLHKGFDITWQADPAKDKEGKARLSIEVK